MALLKHDSAGPKGDAAILIFNPGAAQNVTINLGAPLPETLTGGDVGVFDLLTNETATSPLSQSWTVEMGELEMKFFTGFSLGVFAPRTRKRDNCIADNEYVTYVTGSMQDCFSACLADDQCKNVHVEFVDIVWMESPPPLKCTLLGEIADADSTCEKGTGTLITRLDDGRPDNNV